MYKKNLNIFTYDYPYIGNDSKFIIDEINFLAKKFKTINIIPLKKKKNLIKKLNHNIKINLDLITEIYNPLNFFLKIINIFLCPYFWNEIWNISKKNYLRKLIMVFTERYIAESIFFFVKNNSKISKGILYSIWSNHTLVAFYLLKKKLLIKDCFARTLGRDLKGFIPNDDYIAYKKIKFKKLNFLLTLNDEQEKILSSYKLINKSLIFKNYLGINKEKKSKVSIKYNSINFASCGSFIHIKNNLEILRFVYLFSKNNPNYNVNYYCIGKGEEENKILEFVKKNVIKNLNFFHIKNVSSLPNFLKKKKINFFINLSYTEGLSFALMEAMSCSIPIICSNIPGNLEVVNTQNGYIVENKNTETYKKISNKIVKDYEGKEYKKKSLKTLNTVIKKISRKKNHLLLDQILKKFF